MSADQNEQRSSSLSSQQHSQQGNNSSTSSDERDERPERPETPEPTEKPETSFITYKSPILPLKKELLPHHHQKFHDKIQAVPTKIGKSSKEVIEERTSGAPGSERFEDHLDFGRESRDNLEKREIQI